MKNIIKIISVFIFGVFVFTSCMEEAEDMFHAPDDNADSFLQFTTLNGVFAMTPADTLAYTFDFGVKIIGQAPTSDMTVTLEVLENTVDLATQVVLSGLEIVIPANTLVGYATMTIDPLAFELSPDTLKLKLAASGGLPTANFGGEAMFNFVYNVCPFDIFDFLGGYTCNEEGYGEYGVSFGLVDEENLIISNSNFWDWAAAGALVNYQFSGDANQTILIPDQPFEFGDGVVGSVDGVGTYDACTSTFSCDYNVWYGGSNYPTHHDFYQGGKNLPQIPVTKALYFK